MSELVVYLLLALFALVSVSALWLYRETVHAKRLQASKLMAKWRPYKLIFKESVRGRWRYDVVPLDGRGRTEQSHGAYGTLNNAMTASRHLRTSAVKYEILNKSQTMQEPVEQGDPDPDAKQSKQGDIETINRGKR